MATNGFTACAAAFSLAACGAAGDTGGSGDVTPVGTSTVVGTVAGRAFSSLDGVAGALPPATCTVSGVSASMAGVAMGLTDFTGACAVVGSACGKASAQGLVVVVANLSLAGTATPVGPGSYPVSQIGSIPLASSVAFAALGRTDATCGFLAGVPEVTGGTVTLSAVNSAFVSGSVLLGLADGSTLSGPFSAIACAGFQVDPCSGAVTGLGGGTCTGPRSCLP